MHQTATVLVRKASEYVSYQPVSPTRWQGNKNCLAGPFSDQSVAAYFASYAEVLYRDSQLAAHVFVKRDSWYVEMAHEKRENHDHQASP